MTFSTEVSQWYPEQVGKLVTHLHALEYVLRGRLSYEDPDVNGRPAADMRLAVLQPGDSVPVNSLTSYESLDQLIIRYNGSLPQEDDDLEADPSVGRLRDAVAHGRLVPIESEARLRLVKFARPEGNQTSVEFAETLTPEWIKSQCLRLQAEFEKVFESMDRAQKRMAQG